MSGSQPALAGDHAFLQERYHLATRVSRTAIWDHDLQSGTFYIEPLICELCGCSVADLPEGPEALLSLIHPEDRNLFLSLGDPAVHLSREQECRLQHTNGYVIWANLTVEEVCDSNGQVQRRVGVVSDITKRKLAELFLRKQEERYRDLVENINDVIFLLDQAGRLTFISPVLQHIAGYSPEDILGRRLMDFVHTEDRGVIDDLLSTVSRGEDNGGEFRLLTREGAAHWFVVRLRPMWHDTQISGARGVLTDISEVRFLQDRYHTLFQQALDGIIIEDGDQNIIEANPSAAKIFGYSVEELQTMKTAALRWEAGPPLSIYQNPGKYSQAPLELDARRKEGKRIIIELTIVPVPAAHGHYFLSVVRDISERKTIEHRLRTSLQEKEVLLSEVHHRVKNNMQIISSLLNLQAESVADPAIQAMFQESHSRIRAMALIHEQLYHSRDLAHIDFRRYVEEMASHLMELYPATAAAVRLDLEIQDVFLDVETSIPLGLIVNELFTNALKYAFPGGRAGSIRIQLEQKNADGYRFVFADDGVGLPAELEPRTCDSLGLNLLFLLGEDQLGGTVDVKGTTGTAVTIVFGE